MEFTIREARPDDAATIAAFNSAMAEETEGKKLDPGRVGPGVDVLLRDRSMGRYWVAQSDQAVIGQLMVTYEWSDWRNGNIWWIQSVYVQPNWRRKGVFSSLYRHVRSLADATPDVIGLRLYVDADNLYAQQTYRALGMEKSDYLVMEDLFRATPIKTEN
jgi:ribosomal protein S18 acetylase RimI-like enzyme